MIVCSSPTLVTHIMGKVNISFKQLQAYLSTLIKDGRIAYDGRYYTVTERGAKYLDKLQELYAIAN